MRTLLALFLVASLTIYAADACILGTYSSCSTSSANGLFNQLIAEMGKMGYSFTSLSSSTYSSWIHCSNCQLQSGSANALLNAAKSKNDYITVNSAYRTSAEQYLLYNMYKQGRCGIMLAAVPGTSDHESGRAIDTSYYDYWRSTLAAYGWSWTYGSSDPYHFDYFNDANLSKKTLEAFQRLWNAHNPTSQIGVDGIYGTQTANALYNSPCSGW